MSNIKDEVVEYCGIEAEDMKIFLPKKYDKCLIGFVTICGTFFPAYNFDLLIEKISKELEINEREAIIHFNTKILEKKPDLAFIRFTDDFNEICSYNEGLLIMEEYPKALVGVKIQKGQEIVAVYDENKCIEILSESMSEEDAWDYFDFNISSAYVGEFTPALLNYIT